MACIVCDAHALAGRLRYAASCDDGASEQLRTSGTSPTNTAIGWARMNMQSCASIPVCRMYMFVYTLAVLRVEAVCTTRYCHVKTSFSVRVGTGMPSLHIPGRYAYLFSFVLYIIDSRLSSAYLTSSIVLAHTYNRASLTHLCCGGWCACFAPRDLQGHRAPTCVHSPSCMYLL